MYLPHEIREVNSLSPVVVIAKISKSSLFHADYCVCHKNLFEQFSPSLLYALLCENEVLSSANQQIANCVVLNLSVFNANLENDKTLFMHSNTCNREGEKYSKRFLIVTQSMSRICFKNQLFYIFARRPTLVCRPSNKFR